MLEINLRIFDQISWNSECIRRARMHTSKPYVVHVTAVFISRTRICIHNACIPHRVRDIRIYKSVDHVFNLLRCARMYLLPGVL